MSTANPDILAYFALVAALGVLLGAIKMNSITLPQIGRKPIDKEF